MISRPVLFPIDQSDSIGLGDNLGGSSLVFALTAAARMASVARRNALVPVKREGSLIRAGFFVAIKEARSGKE